MIPPAQGGGFFYPAFEKDQLSAVGISNVSRAYDRKLVRRRQIPMSDLRDSKRSNL